ncbi:MAG: hypothetical protein C5S52_04515 [ANME-2 cluster archaeon]|nr:hypothetical protein [ANME-2 cluster archaeon]
MFRLLPADALSMNSWRSTVMKITSGFSSMIWVVISSAIAASSGLLVTPP